MQWFWQMSLLNIHCVIVCHASRKLWRILAQHVICRCSLIFDPNVNHYGDNMKDWVAHNWTDSRPLGEFCCCMFISKNSLNQHWYSPKVITPHLHKNNQVQHWPVEYDSFWSQHLCFAFDSLWFKIWVTVATSLDSVETGWRLNTVHD